MKFPYSNNHHHASSRNNRRDDSHYNSHSHNPHMDDELSYESSSINTGTNTTTGNNSVADGEAIMLMMMRDLSTRDSNCQDDLATPTNTAGSSSQRRGSSSFFSLSPRRSTNKPSSPASSSSSSTTKKDYDIWQRAAMTMAKHPKTHFWLALTFALAIGVTGMIAGQFSVAADNEGWHSRGTLVSDRETQVMLVKWHDHLLATKFSQDAWNDLTQNVQPGWESGGGYENIYETGYRRRQRHLNELLLEEESKSDNHFNHQQRTGALSLSANHNNMKLQGQAFHQLITRHLQETQQEDKANSTSSSSTTNSFVPSLDSCDTDWYLDGRMTNQSRLWPVWKVASRKSAFDTPVLQQLCESEQTTQRLLQQRGLCFGCAGSQCLPPLGLVMFVRFQLWGGMDMDCATLATNFQEKRPDMEQQLQDCVKALQTMDGDLETLEDMPQECPLGFSPNMVDDLYFANDDSNSQSPRIIQYTSTLFATYDNVTAIQQMYDMRDQFDKGHSSTIVGAYDTQHEDLKEIFAEDIVSSDMLLAMGSAAITALAILVHTRSPFLTLVGLVQIVLSFPLAYFTYYFIFGLQFFPFLNFIGVFVVFALGADDVFVAVDKWKNARHDLGAEASREEVAALALPDAAGAMLLTTSTTAIAFFGTAICPVAPIKMFAIFCGWLIVWDYVMNVLLIFPCLVIYDSYQQDTTAPSKWYITCHWLSCMQGDQDVADDSGDDLENGLEAPSTSPTAKSQLRASATTDPTRQTSHTTLKSAGGSSTTSELVNRSQSTRNSTSGSVFRNEPTARTESDESMEANSSEVEKPSLIRRILLQYYNQLHRFRYVLLVASVIVLVISAVIARNLDLPTSPEVRFLKPSHEFERAFSWRMELLGTSLATQDGNEAQIIWGVVADDTGKLTDPKEWSQLVLDDSFDPSPTEAQQYMLQFCDSLFDEAEFATPISPNFECPINVFDKWLRNQSSISHHHRSLLTEFTMGDNGTMMGTDLPNGDERVEPATDAPATNDEEEAGSTTMVIISEHIDPIYREYCNGASRLPMDPATFHPCLTAWAQDNGELNVLSRNGIVTIMMVPYMSRIRWDSPNHVLKREWADTEKWMNDMQREVAPPTVNKAFFSSLDYRWYDTTVQIYDTAWGSMAIAIAASAVIVALSSRSLVMTLFSAISVAFVLASVTAIMVGLGWNLGFLESICFAILIGVSVDFVIHFSHAYTSFPGTVSKEKRTKHALIYMGPSVLASAVTTIAGALIMFGCTITFFTKFATVLFFTIVMSLVGSFVVFLAMADTIGPANPTYLADKCSEKYCTNNGSGSTVPIGVGKDEEGEDEEDLEPPQEAAVAAAAAAAAAVGNPEEEAQEQVRTILSLLAEQEEEIDPDFVSIDENTMMSRGISLADSAMISRDESKRSFVSYQDTDASQSVGTVTVANTASNRRLMEAHNPSISSGTRSATPVSNSARGVRSMSMSSGTQSASSPPPLIQNTMSVSTASGTQSAGTPLSSSPPPLMHNTSMSSGRESASTFASLPRHHVNRVTSNNSVSTSGMQSTDVASTDTHHMEMQNNSFSSDLQSMDWTSVNGMATSVASTLASTDSAPVHRMVLAKAQSKLSMQSGDTNTEPEYSSLMPVRSSDTAAEYSV